MYFKLFVCFSSFIDPAANTSHRYTFNIEQNIKHDEVKPKEIIEDEETKNVIDTLVRDINTRVEDIKLHDPTDTNCSSDSDNQSIVSLSESNSSKSIPEEFVVIPIPDCFKIDQIPNNEDVPAQQIDEGKDLVTDSVGISVASGIKKQVSEGSLKSTTDPVLDNSDDNNNSEKANQNTSGAGSPIRSDDSFSNDGSQKSDLVLISIPNKEEEDNAGMYII